MAPWPMKLEVLHQYALNALFLPIPAPVIVLDGPETLVHKTFIHRPRTFDSRRMLVLVR